MQAANPAPTYDAFFERGTLWQQIRMRNPYEFSQTYHLLRAALGYQAHYVNYGYWVDGHQTVEPGRKLALLVGERMGLKPGNRLVEAGSGLGQAAVDLAKHFQLASVNGINPCVPQVNFANALAKHNELDHVRHHVGDACTMVSDFLPFDHALALECIGHFPDGDAFLRAVLSGLPSGGRIGFTLVTSPKPPGAVTAAFEDAFFGVVPMSGADWVKRLEAAGFTDIRRDDITDVVLKPMIDVALDRMANDPEAGKLSFMQRFSVGSFLKVSRSAVASGRMGYELLTGMKP